MHHSVSYDFYYKKNRFSYTAIAGSFYKRDGECLLRGTDWHFTEVRVTHFNRGRSMAQVVIRRPLKTEAWFQFEDISFRICFGKMWNCIRHFSQYFCSSSLALFRTRSILIFI